MSQRSYSSSNSSRNAHIVDLQDIENMIKHKLLWTNDNEVKGTTAKFTYTSLHSFSEELTSIGHRILEIAIGRMMIHGRTIVESQDIEAALQMLSGRPDPELRASLRPQQ